MDYKLRFCYAEVRVPLALTTRLWLSPSSDDSSESYSSLLDASSPLLLESPEDEPLPLELDEPEPLRELKVELLSSSCDPSSYYCSEPSLWAAATSCLLVTVLGTC